MIQKILLLFLKRQSQGSKIVSININIREWSIMLFDNENDWAGTSATELKLTIVFSNVVFSLKNCQTNFAFIVIDIKTKSWEIRFEIWFSVIFILEGVFFLKEAAINFKTIENCHQKPKHFLSGLFDVSLLICLFNGPLCESYVVFMSVKWLLWVHLVNTSYLQAFVSLRQSERLKKIDKKENR